MKNSFADVGADAQINLARGVVVTNAKIAAHLAFDIARSLHKVLGVPADIVLA